MGIEKPRQETDIDRRIKAEEKIQELVEQLLNAPKNSENPIPDHPVPESMRGKMDDANKIVNETARWDLIRGLAQCETMDIGSLHQPLEGHTGSVLREMHVDDEKRKSILDDLEVQKQKMKS